MTEKAIKECLLCFLFSSLSCHMFVLSCCETHTHTHTTHPWIAIILYMPPHSGSNGEMKGLFFTSAQAAASQTSGGWSTGWGGDIVMVVHAVVTRRERMTCKSGGVEGAPSLSHFPISFSSQTLERSADLSPRGQHSHFDPLLLACNTCSPLPHSQLLLPPVTSPDWLFSFRSLSPYYSYLFPTLYEGGEAFSPVIQVLVSTAPFSSTARVYLSHRCPSAAAPTPAFGVLVNPQMSQNGPFQTTRDVVSVREELKIR